MSLTVIVILALIQGAAELLPISSSAHVIVAAKLLKVGLKPDDPAFVLLLVMLHTGTMFAVIVYFWGAWKRAFFSSREAFKRFARLVIIATAVTGILGFGLKIGIEHIIKADVEALFGKLWLIAGGLAAVGVLILISGIRAGKQPAREEITDGESLAIGAIQGLCLPFRGFSRSGSTISLGLLLGVAKTRAEEFSFALAVVLTPALVAREVLRLIKHRGEAVAPVGWADFYPSLIGMVFSFIAGLIALKLLSRLLERGKWWVFGIYCCVAAAAVFALYRQGY